MPTDWTTIVVILLLAGQAALIGLLIVKIRQLSWQVFRLVEEVRQRDRQAQILDQLHRVLKLERGALPPARVWSASPDILLELARHCLRHRPKTIVDCGSGLSTVVLARCCELNGGGHIVSLEESPEHAQRVLEALDELDLESFVTLHSGPLVIHDSSVGPLRWYALDRVAEEGIDLVFVDGPANIDGTGARYPAGPLLLPRLAADGLVIVDDADRPDEVHTLQRWQAEHPDLRCRRVEAEKGAAILHR